MNIAGEMTICMSTDACMSTVQLHSYLQRIGLARLPEKNLAGLNELMSAHIGHIPFENIDVLLKRPVSLEPDAIFAKLVSGQRGGYCFEQNGLFYQVLAALGYPVRYRGGRVRLSHPDRNDLPSRTHLFLEVLLEGQGWLVDVGFGALSMHHALRFALDEEQHFPLETRRITEENGRYFHQVKQAEGWQDVYEFDLAGMPLADQKVANWYTSTSPDTHFTRDLVVAIALPGARRASLLNRQFRIRNRDGIMEERQLQENELPMILKDIFGLSVEDMPFLFPCQ